MAHYSEPQITIKMYDFYKLFYLEIKKWPKPERYNLGKRCEDICLDIIKNLHRAYRLKIKSDILFETNIDLQILRNLIRLGKEMQIIIPKKYLLLEKELFNIGCKLGSWIKRS